MWLAQDRVLTWEATTCDLVESAAWSSSGRGSGEMSLAALIVFFCRLEQRAWGSTTPLIFTWFFAMSVSTSSTPFYEFSQSRKKKKINEIWKIYTQIILPSEEVIFKQLFNIYNTHAPKKD